MSTQRSLSLFVAALALAGLFAVPARAQVTVEFDQPTYEVTQILTATISGPPGSPTFLLVDVAPGNFSFPFGTIGIGFTPLFFVANLGPMPNSGSITVQEAFACRTTAIYGTEIYLQAICVIGGVKTLSETVHIAEMLGDCSDVCTDGIVEIGLQVELEDVNLLTSDSLFVNAWKKWEDSTQNYGPPISVMIYLPDVATGILAEPISNSTGSIVVSMLELDGTTLTIRFFVNAPLAGFPSLEGETDFAISFGASKTLAGTTTDCTQRLKVGDTFGKFTVIKLIDLN